MPEIHCFTSASFAYLDRVRVLAETLRAVHPEWRFWLCLVDQEPIGLTFDAAAEGWAGVVRVGELGLPDLRRQLFQHDVVEMCTAVKGAMLQRLLDGGADRVLYLDPDIAVFSPLDEVLERLDRDDVVLTPHQLAPDSERQAVIDNEIGSLKYGVYNLGFLAVANRPEGRRFAAWWAARLAEFCYDAVPDGLFTDQRWADLAPVLFDRVGVLRDPGYNVASWNLSQRRLVFDDDGAVRVNGALLRFFHFTKVTWVGEIMLERYCGGSLAVFELLRWYRAKLQAHALPGVPDGYWAYGQYRGGEPIPRAHRRLYRDREDLRAAYPDPFAAGPAAFERAA